MSASIFVCILNLVNNYLIGNFQELRKGFAVPCTNQFPISLHFSTGNNTGLAPTNLGLYTMFSKETNFNPKQVEVIFTALKLFFFSGMVVVFGILDVVDRVKQAIFQSCNQDPFPIDSDAESELLFCIHSNSLRPLDYWLKRKEYSRMKNGPNMIRNSFLFTILLGFWTAYVHYCCWRYQLLSREQKVFSARWARLKCHEIKMKFSDMDMLTKYAPDVGNFLQSLYSSEVVDLINFSEKVTR